MSMLAETRVASARAQTANPSHARTPLAVDLDGTLIAGDLFAEAITRLICTRPWRLPQLLFWLLRGRACAKAKLAETTPLDPALLAYDKRVLAWLVQQRASGRTIVLATAANERAAQQVADHLGLFDGVIASDAKRNLKGAAKARALSERFPDGFVYAGDSAADLPVWRAARRPVLANASERLTQKLKRTHDLEWIFPRERGHWAAGLVKALRPRQWAKNVLVFVPLLAGQGWFDLAAWTNAALAFAALSCAASSVYLVNDAADLESDRAHPRKRTRPFASGAVSPLAGLAVSLLLAGAGLAIGAAAGIGALVALYLGAATLYTFWLKQKHMVDVFALTGLYMIRLVIGGVATGFLASSWLLAFSGFFFFSLALVKRAVEIKAAGANARRGYRTDDAPILQMIGISGGLLSCLVLALYLQSDFVAARFGAPVLLWALPAAGMFWLCRLWLLAGRGEVHDDPLVFALRDPASWLTALIAGAAYCFALISPATAIGWFA
jgi:4-hydroxybenzoate polyprenyltransferase